MRLLLALLLLVPMACTSQARRVSCPMVARLVADGEPLCTAFAAASDGDRMYYTAAHCLDAAGDRELTVESGHESSRVIDVASMHSRDIALLTLEARLALPRREASAAEKEGLPFCCLGTETASVRRLAALGKRRDATLVAGRVCRGDSGSPVIDSVGRLIGLISRADLVGAGGCAESYVEVVHLESGDLTQLTRGSSPRRSER